ncbi:MAG: TIM barrel protein [Clostridiales bacterium]
MSEQTGIFSWYGFFTDFNQRIELIKETGFDGIMIWWEDEVCSWPITCSEMVKNTRAMDLDIFNIHMSGCDDNAIWSEDNLKRKKHLEPICRTIEEMADYNLHNLVLHLCEKGEVPAPNKSLLKSIEALIPVAQANNTVLSLENTWRSDYLEAVWAEFPVKELGFCFDTSHANLRDEFYLLEKYNKLLSAYHLSDNDGIKDRHWLPFDGEIDFTKIIPLIKNRNIPYTMELIANTEIYKNEKEFLVEAKNRIDQLITMSE